MQGVGAGVREKVEAGPILGDAFEVLAPEFVVMEFLFGGSQ